MASGKNGVASASADIFDEDSNVSESESVKGVASVENEVKPARLLTDDEKAILRHISEGGLPDADLVVKSMREKQVRVSVWPKECNDNRHKKYRFAWANSKADDYAPNSIAFMKNLGYVVCTRSVPRKDFWSLESQRIFLNDTLGCLARNEMVLMVTHQEVYQEIVAQTKARRTGKARVVGKNRGPVPEGSVFEGMEDHDGSSADVIDRAIANAQANGGHHYQWDIDGEQISFDGQNSNFPIIETDN